MALGMQLHCMVRVVRSGHRAWTQADTATVAVQCRSAMAADCATLSVYSGLLLRVHDGQNSGCYWLACVVVTGKVAARRYCLPTAQSAVTVHAHGLRILTVWATILGTSDIAMAHTRTALAPALCFCCHSA
jgi:hypothetical protein